MEKKIKGNLLGLAGQTTYLAAAVLRCCLDGKCPFLCPLSQSGKHDIINADKPGPQYSRVIHSYYIDGEAGNGGSIEGSFSRRI
jgi:hypothetical protein